MTSMDYYEKVLKKPRFICAPMVDQGDLAFRLLVRRYGAELCYTPMFHAELFVRDKGYRKAVFSTTADDRPLVVQFCANKPENFVAAARLVEDKCDAVDLNLGCPQSIAKVGRYGAFLQDDWQLIAEIVSEAKRCLKVPVFCKIRIFEDVKKTVEYAKLLERSGCSLLAVHGRTRDMKGRNAGLASWEQIRAVVNAVRIPVIANGNVRSLEDAENCLRTTSANGVMSAESLLRNPSLFSKRTDRSEMDIFREYLSLAREHPTHIRIVRSHMFRFLNRIINGCVALQSKLGSCSTLAGMDAFLGEVERFQTENLEPSGTPIMETSDVELQVETEDQGSGASATVEAHVMENWNELPKPLDFRIESDNHLDLSSAEARRERRKSRKEEHHRRTLAARKAKRKEKKTRRKGRLREEREQQRQQQQDLNCVPRDAHIPRRDAVRLAKQRLESALEDGVVVCLDLGLCDHMSSKELGKLSSQIRRLYGINRKTDHPLDLHLINFREDSHLYRDCVTRNQGFESYQLSMHPGGLESVVERRNIRKIIYLSPDAERPLRGPLDRNAIYVVGGLVDETVEKNVSLNLAAAYGAEARRLPILEYLKRESSTRTHSTVLTVNQVVEILIRVNENDGDWESALLQCIPKRKGFVARSSSETKIETNVPSQ